MRWVSLSTVLIIGMHDRGIGRVNSGAVTGIGGKVRPTMDFLINSSIGLKNEGGWWSAGTRTRARV